MTPREHGRVFLPLWKFAFLSIFTAGTFKIYWLFRTWKYIRDREHTNVSPAWGTIRMAIPVLNLIIGFQFFWRIHHVISRGEERDFRYPAVLTAFFLLGELLFVTHFWLWGVLAMYFPLFVVQRQINQFEEHPRMDRQFAWSTRDRILCTVLLVFFCPFVVIFVTEMARRFLGMPTYTVTLLQEYL